VLANRSFFLLLMAQLISQSAQNAILFTLLVIVTNLTRGSTYTSILVLSFVIPSVVFGVFSGVLVDLWSKRLLLIYANVARLLLAIALVNDPAVLFLDEPTTGLDPQARRQLWELIERFRTSGRTTLLTTHYMDEAERLCDRVAIMDHGRVIALGTPRALIAPGTSSVWPTSTTTRNVARVQFSEAA